jgi:hypothetical protein
VRDDLRQGLRGQELADLLERRHVRRDAAPSLLTVAGRARELHEDVRAGCDLWIDPRRRVSLRLRTAERRSSQDAGGETAGEESHEGCAPTHGRTRLCTSEDAETSFR